MPTEQRRAGRRPPLWVVKLGGSLALSAELTAWLDTIAVGRGRLVLVPGGGPFADQVRETQHRWSFDDATAHRLALLAMEQYGLLLASLQPKLQPATSRAAIRHILAGGGVPLWLPTRMAVGRPDIPESWDVTSDSLAAWLAAELGAKGLLLVKSVTIAEGSRVEDLARRGVVDAFLGMFLSRGVPECRSIAASHHRQLRAALADGGMAGTVIVTAPRKPR